MKILPPSPILPSRPIVRRHHPSKMSGRYGYRNYIHCLRWEFGFSCAFCLLHEADLVAGRDAVEWGLFAVEHFAPKGQYLDKEAGYENLFYVCRFCNQARRAIPSVASDNSRLLNPCEVAWADHFRFENDKIVPLSDDPNASYTVEAFDLNDRRKLAARRFRRSTITRNLDGLIRARELRSRLLDEAAASDGEHINLAQTLSRMASFALENLSHYSVIPKDASTGCHCGFTEHLELPVWLDEQALDVGESS